MWARVCDNPATANERLRFAAPLPGIVTDLSHTAHTRQPGIHTFAA